MDDGNQWAIVIAAFAVAGTIANFLFTQWRTDRREVNKWRRDELMKLTSAVLQLSRSRQTSLLHNYEVAIYHSPKSFMATNSDENVYQMEILVEQIRLLDSRLSDRAEAIYELHRQAAQRLADEPDDGNHVWQIEQLMVDGEQMNKLHRALMASFNRALRD